MPLLFLLGISSGLPLALTASTLQAWYTVAGVSTLGIGFLSIVGQPYVFKFLWAPFLDRFQLPLLGRRRGWIAFFQVMIAVMLILIGGFHPEKNPILIAVFAFFIAFLSASQDVDIDAYRAEVLESQERGVGNAFFVTGYRIGLLLAGSLALIIAANMGWQTAYLIMGLIMLGSVFTTIASREPLLKEAPPKRLSDAIIEPFREFILRDNAMLLLCFIVLYKLSDAFSLSLSTTFLLRGMGFSLVELGVVMKTVSIGFTIIGAFIGGFTQARLGLFKSMMLFGLLQGISSLGFMLLSMIGNDLGTMIAVVGFEYACSAMGTTVFLGFLMGLCHQQYTATQFALLSAIASVGRVFVGPIAAIMVDQWGWTFFYFLAFIIALPSLLVLWFLRRDSVFN
jgi:PAT family beta-lactamase induction signal transducer AmpG